MEQRLTFITLEVDSVYKSLKAKGAKNLQPVSRIQWRKVLLLFSIVVFSIGKTYSQVEIKGIVIDSISKKTIPFANIIIKGSLIGTSTDDKGKFNIKVQSLPITLIFTSLSYNTREVKVLEPDVKISLMPKTYQLEEIEIKNEVVKNIQKDKSVMTIDYEFYDDFILSIGFKNKSNNPYLFLTDDDGEIISQRPLKIKPESLYKDCLGNIHIMSADSVYQVYYDYQSIRLIYPTDKRSFAFNMFPCKTYDGSKLYFQYPTFKGLRVKYLVAGKGEVKKLYTIEDSAKISYINSKFDLKYYVKKRREGSNGYLMPVSQIIANLDFFREQEPLDFLDGNMISPINAPIIKLNNTINIFDCIHSTCISFDTLNLEMKNKTPFTFHQQKNWGGEVIIDEAKQELYTFITKNSITYLLKLDPITYEIKKEIKVPEKPFISEIKIRGGNAYFLYRNAINDEYRYIFKMRI